MRINGGYDVFFSKRMEWWLAIASFLLGSWIAGVDNSMSRGIYEDARLWLSDVQWGLVLALIGLSHLIALAVNGLSRFSPHVRATAAALTCLFFGALASRLYHVDQSSVTTMLVAGYSFAALLAFGNASRDIIRAGRL